MIQRAGSIDIAYDAVGDGPPIVFLHSFPLNRKLWSPQLRALAGFGRCLAPDSRGFGQSEVAPPYTMDQYADDVIALLDSLEMRERVTFVGISMGGYVALALWRRHRHRVRALVLADTRATADTEEAREKRRVLNRTAKERGIGAVADLQLAGLIGKTTRLRHPTIAAEIRAMISSAPIAGVVGASEAMMARPDSTELLSSIDVPTLVIVGQEDVLTPPVEAEALCAAIPGCQVQIIPNAGHSTCIERPAAFNHTVGEFLSKVGDLT
ncbi:MAG: alpha/beta fold hydrolase [Anaerolineae bacterium]|nr:alpha/beta fold hydrolase [Gemmatimonadaceae bacterium]